MEASSIKPKSDDFRSFINLVWRRKWILMVTVAIITSGAVGAMLLFSETLYKSSVDMLQRRSGLDEILLGSPIIQSTYPEREMETAKELVESPTVVNSVIDDLNDRIDGLDVGSAVEVETIRESDILRITTTAPDPQLASDMANSFAAYYIEWRREVDRDLLQGAIAPIEQEVLNTPVDQRETAEYRILKERLDSLQLMESLQTGNFEVVKPAVPASSPSSPKPLRTGIMALFISTILGVGLVFLADHFDNSIHNTDEIEEGIDKPILTVVPCLNPSSNGKPATLTDPSGSYSESFRLLRTNLGYIEPDRKTKTIMVTSAGPGEGKSTTIANLAITLSRSGQRVIIIEGDFRRPSLARQLGLDNTIGVTNFIAGTSSFREILQMIEAKELATQAVGRAVPRSDEQTESAGKLDSTKPIYCATSGPLPPNPGEIATSDKMAKILEEAAAHADVVLLDVPPVGVVGDASSMASRVDGILLVVSMEKTSRRSFDTLQNFISSVPSNVLGLVVNGYKTGRFGNYGYSYGNYQYGSYSND